MGYNSVDWFKGKSTGNHVVLVRMKYGVFLQNFP